ncbi:zona pellucida-binding protein 2 isoform X2 [Lissotriton helveticus]
MAGLGLRLQVVLLFVCPLSRLEERGSRPTEEKSAVPKDAPSPKKRFVYGKENQEVKVYVEINRNSPFLVCMDEKLAHRETIDPYYLWIGPNGRNIKGQSYVNLTETGKLALKFFTKDMSGAYMCTLSYTSFSNNVLEEKEKFKAYKFIVLAYREPDYTFQINVRYSTSQCDVPSNDRFFEELKTILDDLIFGLTCQLTDAHYKCHVIKAPKHGLQNEIFITFRLSPFGAGWEAVCRQITHDCEEETNKRVTQARDRLEEFFQQQPVILKKEFDTVPEIHYLENSLEVTRLDNCRPGFGKNEVTHNDCSGCCVVCDPGTYSSDNNAHCKMCSSIRIHYYGATAC